MKLATAAASWLTVNIKWLRLENQQFKGICVRKLATVVDTPGRENPRKNPSIRSKTARTMQWTGRTAERSFLQLRAVRHCNVNTIWQWFNCWQNVCLTACALTLHIAHCFWSISGARAGISKGAWHVWHACSIHT